MTRTITIKACDNRNLKATKVARKNFIQELKKLSLPYDGKLDIRESKAAQRVASVIDKTIDRVNYCTRKQFMRHDYATPRFGISAQNEFKIYLDSANNSYFQIIIILGDFKSIFQINFDDIVAVDDTVKYLQNAVENYNQFLSRELTYLHDVNFSSKL